MFVIAYEKKTKTKTAPSPRRRALYVISPCFRVNMAASMASQAAARGLRAATSKNILLDKFKVLLYVTRSRMHCPPCHESVWPPYVRCYRLRESLLELPC